MSIKTLDQLITVLTTMKGNITTYQAAVGATAADITFASNALANLDYLRDYAEAVDAFKKGVFQMKQTAYNGDVNEVIGPFPVVVAGASPTPLAAGYLERVNNPIKRDSKSVDRRREIFHFPIVICHWSFAVEGCSSVNDK